MTTTVTVLKGKVKYFPEGSGRDSESEILEEGDTVELKADWGLDPQDIAPEDIADGMLKYLMEAHIERDKNAPAFGSASSVEDREEVDGGFKIETDGMPLIVRVYAKSKWIEHLVTRDEPLTLATLEGNAVTAALYGVSAE